MLKREPLCPQVDSVVIVLDDDDAASDNDNCRFDDSISLRAQAYTNIFSNATAQSRPGAAAGAVDAMEARPQEVHTLADEDGHAVL
jgi:hypothetical protein